MRTKTLKRFFLLTMLVPAMAYGEEHEGHSVSDMPSSVENLSTNLRNLLSEEMRQLQKGMTEIFPHYVSGNWEAIAPIASKMENSYVLKQNLSEEQVHELHSKLPSGFIELDQKFHYLSGMLEHAAKMEKPELIGFYYSKMGETCVSCHTQYAGHKFPKLMSEVHVH